MKQPDLTPSLDRPFVAIDFETADNGRDSACAIGMVRVEGLKIVARERMLIRPPRPDFLFTHIHGITWSMVRHAPDFRDVWAGLSHLVADVDYLAAHNAVFDRGVLAACCTAAGIGTPELPFTCTVKLARQCWNIYPTTLSSVCTRLNIKLKHHDPLSDAEACANIVIAASKAMLTPADRPSPTPRPVRLDRGTSPLPRPRRQQ